MMKFLWHFPVLSIFALIAIPISPLFSAFILIRDAIKYRGQEEFSISPYAFAALFLGAVLSAPFRVIFGYLNVLLGWRPNDKLKDAFPQILMWGID